MSGLTQISFVEDLGSTPATVNRRTGEMYISARMWRRMTPNQRLFMLLHEQGHVTLKTTNEFEADGYAFEQYVKTGRSLKSCISALTGVLSGKSPEHLMRAKALLERAIIFDKQNKKYRR
jgi:predicted ATPase